MLNKFLPQPYYPIPKITAENSGKVLLKKMRSLGSIYGMVKENLVMP